MLILWGKNQGDDEYLQEKCQNGWFRHQKVCVENFSPLDSSENNVIEGSSSLKTFLTFG